MSCSVIISVSPDQTPILCGWSGVELGGVVKCSKHWAKSRRRAARMQIIALEESLD